jgi:hypothetical protein
MGSGERLARITVENHAMEQYRLIMLGRQSQCACDEEK